MKGERNPYNDDVIWPQGDNLAGEQGRGDVSSAGANGWVATISGMPCWRSMRAAAFRFTRADDVATQDLATGLLRLPLRCSRLQRTSAETVMAHPMNLPILLHSG